MGISEKGIPLGIWNSTAGEPQPGHKARINPFSRFRRNREKGLANTANQCGRATFKTNNSTIF